MSENPVVALEARLTQQCLREITDEIVDQCLAQERKYPGTTCASEDLSENDKATILLCEAAEAAEEAKMHRWPWTREMRTGRALTDAEVRQRWRKELLQTCAVAVATIEWIDAQGDDRDH